MIRREKLISHLEKKDVNFYLEPSLHISHQIIFFENEMISNFFQAGMSADVEDENGETALFKALFLKKEVINLFLENGADINHQDKEGNSLMLYLFEEPNTLLYFLGKGLDPFLKNKQGKAMIDILIENHHYTNPGAILCHQILQDIKCQKELDILNETIPINNTLKSTPRL